jgi:hypothetical protein
LCALTTLGVCGGLTAPTVADPGGSPGVLRFAAPVVLAGHCGGEPSITTDLHGHVYVSGIVNTGGPGSKRHCYATTQVPNPTGQPIPVTTQGIPVWVSADGGRSFGAQQRVGAAEVLGGDSDIVADRHDGSVYLAEMQVYGMNLCRSVDHGRSWQSFPIGAQSCTDNPLELTGQLEAIDRPYLLTYGPTARFPHREVFATFRDGNPTGNQDAKALFVSVDGLPFRPVPGPDTNSAYFAETADSGISWDRPQVGPDGDLYFQLWAETIKGLATDAGFGLDTQIWLGRLHHPGQIDQSWRLTKAFDANRAPGVFNNSAMTMDPDGNLYIIFTGNVGSTRTADHVYLIHSSDHGLTWTKPAQIGNPNDLYARPAITAPSAGRVLLGWYRSSIGSNAIDTADRWTYDVAMVTAATSSTPAIGTEIAVSNGIAHYGAICGEDQACPANLTPGGGSVGTIADFTSASYDEHGCALFAYTDDRAILPDMSNWDPRLANITIARQEQPCNTASGP